MLSRSLGKRVVVVDVYVDNDMSAYSGKPRKHYIRMLGDLKAGRADLILAWHTDRLHRSPAELEEYILVCQPREVATYCVKAGHLDLTTPAGRLVARNLGAAARYEVEHMSERICSQKIVALSRGEWIGGARPFGYAGPIRDAYGNVLNREEVGVKLIGHEVAMIQNAVSRVISGESLYAICKEWTAMGVETPRGSKRWLPATLKRILIRPRNAGLVEHNGEVLRRSGICGGSCSASPPSTRTTRTSTTITAISADKHQRPPAREVTERQRIIATRPHSYPNPIDPRITAISSTNRHLALDHPDLIDAATYPETITNAANVLRRFDETTAGPD